jgi:hypothetical protein
MPLVSQPGERNLYRYQEIPIGSQLFTRSHTVEFLIRFPGSFFPIDPFRFVLSRVKIFFCKRNGPLECSDILHKIQAVDPVRTLQYVFEWCDAVSCFMCSLLISCRAPTMVLCSGSCTSRDPYSVASLLLRSLGET